MQEKQYLTGAEVVDLLGICSRTLIRLRQRGEIPFVKIGRNVRYPREALMEHITRQPITGGR